MTYFESVLGLGSPPSSRWLSTLPLPAASSQSQALSRTTLKARDALVLEHLPLAVAERFREAVAIVSVTAHRFFPLVERDELIQVAREARVRSAPRCITCAIRAAWCGCLGAPMKQAIVPWGTSASMPAVMAGGGAEQELALEQLVNQLPTAQATAMQLTLLEGLSLRAAAERLKISAMSVQPA